MKKQLIAILFISALILSACGTDEKWYNPDPNMPEAYIQQNTEILNTNLEILKDDPENLDALFEVAFRYDLLGDYKNAAEYYKKVLKTDPKHFPALNNMANLYEKVKEYKQAAEYVMDLYSDNPDNIDVIKDTVRILLEADMPDQAEQALENFAKLQKDKNIEGMDTLISDLYESIFNYNKNNENP